MGKANALVAWDIYELIYTANVHAKDTFTMRLKPWSMPQFKVNYSWLLLWLSLSGDFEVFITDDFTINAQDKDTKCD